MHLFFSVGEPSGDQHTAHLLEALRAKEPNAVFSGFGGPRMDDVGFANLFRLTDLAVMGLGSVLPHIKTFYAQYRRAIEFFRDHKPDAVVLVDCPGFNWWIAKAARRVGIPVLYYLPPQLWAWAPWRIRKVRRNVDVILAALPFEAEWYQQRGVEVEYVGHPFFDEVASHSIDHNFVDHCRRLSDGTPARIVGILPGSRTQEVQRNFPVMLRVMRELSHRHQDVGFRVACYREAHRDFCRRHLVGDYAELPVELNVGRTPEIIEAAECCLMTSGSVSLELLARETPAVVQYRTGVLVGALCAPLVRCKYISLPNLLADRELMPEHAFVFHPEQHARSITEQLDGWLSDRSRLESAQDDLRQLLKEVGQTGGIERAAEAILRRMGHQPAQAIRHAA